MRLFSDVSSRISDVYLRRAWLLAENGAGTTSPNPIVGCVVVRDDVVVGEGWHERAGHPHAEVMALRAAGDRAHGATAYVTLEPCAHHGRTGPCAQALIEAGVSHVVIGMADPNPDVAGDGASVLRNAGIDVAFAEDPEPFAIQNEAWLHAIAAGRPFVQVKVALTLDGHAAIHEGAPTQLTGEAASALTMRLRARADAILVGAGTLRADDPALTARDPDGTPAVRQPLRVVLGGSKALPTQARMLHDGLGPVAVLTALPAELGDAGGTAMLGGAEILTYDRTLPDALRVLAGRGVVRLLVEAGPRLFTALVDADLVDELVLYHAGGFVGPSGPGLYRGAGPRANLEKRFSWLESGGAGEDAVTVWRPRKQDLRSEEGAGR